MLIKKTSQLLMASQLIIFIIIMTLIYISSEYMENLEHKLLSSVVEKEFNYINQELRSSNKSYKIRDDILYFRTNTLPYSFNKLKENGFYHDIKFNDKSYHVLVDNDYYGDKLYLAYDISEYENEEFNAHIILYFVAVFLIISLVIFYIYMFKNLFNPIKELAANILKNKGTPLDFDFNKKYINHEVSSITKSLNKYMVKINNILEDEKLFTSITRHEIRNSLAVIESSIEIISSDQSLSENIKNHINKISHKCKSLNDSTSNILFLLRNDTYDGSKMIDISDITIKIIKEYQDKVIGKIKIHLVDAVTNNINMNIYDYETIIYNLLNNAITHANCTLINIELSDNVILVSDNGVGIDENIFPKIFEKNIKSNKSDGVGLGLFIVKKICDNYGFKINLTTDKGHGFKISIIYKK